MTRLVAAKDLYVLAVMALVRGVTLTGSPRMRDAVARAVAAAAFRLSYRKRHGSEAMLARVFGARLSARRRRAIVRRVFDEFWLDAFSLAALRGVPSPADGSIAGVEHLRRALMEGRGVILWISNHFGRITTFKRTLHAHGFPVHKVHAANHLGGFRSDRDPDTVLQQRVITPFFEAHEREFVAGIVAITPRSLAYTRHLGARLAANGIVCIAGDATLGRRHLPLPFFGVPERYPTGVVTLAKTSGAVVLPAFCLRGPHGTPRVVIEPPLAVGADVDRERGAEEILRRFVTRLERYARRHPSSYLNWHMIGEGAATV